MALYSPPQWSTTGRNAFGIYLEVIKGGVAVEQLQLPRSEGRSYAVAGRMETVCDLPLAHPSISRVHAALQFDEHGALFLYDMCSTHGCFVNKQRVQAEEFVRLHIGDVLVFGESTRLYAVCGPPELLPAEYESLNLSKFRERLDKNRNARKTNKQWEEQGASWGFREDAEEEEDEESGEEDVAKSREDLPDYLRNLKDEDQPYKSSVSESQVNEKDQRLYQQLQTRIRKMENLKLEKSRILAKQNQLNGLSEGQQNTLDRNEQRIVTLMKEIADLEGRIHAKNDQRNNHGGLTGTAAKKKRSMNDELYGYDSDEDDFYDRTKANQEKIAAREQKMKDSTDICSVPSAMTTMQAPKSEVLTADSIQANVTKLEAKLVKLQDELTAASIAASSAARKDANQEEQVDSLDSFMTATTTQLCVNDVDMLTKRKNETELELKRQRQLLAVVTPALAALPFQKPSADSGKQLVEDSSSVLFPKVQTPDQVPASVKSVTKPVKVEAGNHDPASEQKPEVSALPSDKQKTRPASSQGPQNAAEKLDSESIAPKRQRIVGPAMNPLQQMKPRAIDEQRSDDSSILEGGDQVWVPPTNQTGDGRTKLNDKYGY